jgi:hypothetical protein
MSSRGRTGSIPNQVAMLHRDESPEMHPHSDSDRVQLALACGQLPLSLSLLIGNQRSLWAFHHLTLRWPQRLNHGTGKDALVKNCPEFCGHSFMAVNYIGISRRVTVILLEFSLSGENVTKKDAMSRRQANALYL